MDDGLKTYLDAKFADVNEKFAGLDLKFAGVNERFAGLDAKFAGLDEKFADLYKRFSGLDSKFADLYEKFGGLDLKFAEVRDEIERTETRLLTEFWKWGRSNDQRTRRVEQSDATTVERLSLMEERIFALERRALGGKE